MKPFNLIQLAGRQVVPNLQLAMSLHRAGMLRRHVIMHTDNERESLEPARQVLRLLGALEPPLAYDPVLQEVDESAQSVFRSGRDLIQELGSAERWILHTTGGTKLMSTGLQMLARDPAVELVVYCGMGGRWVAVKIDAHGEPDDRPLPTQHPIAQALGSPGAQLDALPLDTLLSTQFSNDGTIEKLVGAETAGTPDLAAWYRRAVRYGGGFSDGPEPGSAGSWNGDGGAFECFVAHILRQCGIKRVVWNFKAMSGGATSVVESDVVACHENQLVFYDLKLESPRASAKTEQLRAAWATATQFGGLSAACVVVRPNWPPAHEVIDFAAATRCRLVHRGNFGDLLGHLLAPYRGLRPARHLDPLQRAVSEHARTRDHVLFHHRPSIPRRA